MQRGFAHHDLDRGHRSGGYVTRSTFSNRFDASESLLHSAVVHDNDVQQTVVRTTTHAYALPADGPWPWPDLLGGSFQNNVNFHQTGTLTPQKQRKIIEDNTTWTWAAVANGTHPAFNEYAHVTRTRRGNSFDGVSALIERNTWMNDTTLWVLGRPVDHINASASPEETVRHNVYNASDDTLSEHWAFGRKIMDYAWYGSSDAAPGQLQSFTDAKSHKTTLSDYKRGIPQTIQYPDQSEKTVVVDDLGQITSVTDEEDHTTGYHYDDMGRLTTIEWPVGDPHSWSSCIIDYDFVSGSAYGIPGGQPFRRHTVHEGVAWTVTVYDALLQPLLTHQYDVTDTSTQVTHRVDYDWAGRDSFISIPVGGTPNYAVMTTGTRKHYDALGRLHTTTQDSELGTLTTTVDYLASNKRKVTNTRHYATTTTYQSFDAPAYDKPIHVLFADGTTTDVARDWYGHPTQMAQQGTWTPPGESAPQSISVSHTFVYDSYHRPSISTTTRSPTASPISMVRLTGTTHAAT